MAKGGGIQNIMKQAQKLQSKMMKIQDEVAEKTVEASSGGGMITAVVNGKQELVSLKIEPDVVDPDDIEMLQDLVVAAVNSGLSESKEMVNKEMGKVAAPFGGLPGMF